MGFCGRWIFGGKLLKWWKKEDLQLSVPGKRGDRRVRRKMRPGPAAGMEYLTVPEVCYRRISMEPFREPPGVEASAKGLSRRRQST